jgi:hypothetical protein
MRYIDDKIFVGFTCGIIRWFNLDLMEICAIKAHDFGVNCMAVVCRNELTTVVTGGDD